MNVKKLIIWLVLTVVAIVALDVLFGAVFGHHLKTHVLPGDYEMTDHVLRDFDDDILVLGSSVALNGINTKTLEDSLGASAYNGAANGQAFPFYLTMLKAVIRQDKPRYVILGLTPNNLVDSGIGQRYNFLAPYYGRGISDIDSVLHAGDKVERLFLKSSFYRLNRIWFRIFLYNFVSAGIKGENGFIAKPLPPVFPERMVSENADAVSDERRLQFEEFASICRDNGIGLMVVLTPRCVVPSDAESPVTEYLRRMSGRYGYRFYDDACAPPFDCDSTLFYDAMHINIEGSKIYTDTIISRMK